MALLFLNFNYKQKINLNNHVTNIYLEIIYIFK